MVFLLRIRVVLWIFPLLHGLSTVMGVRKKALYEDHGGFETFL